jgi:hypothetical protein
LAGGVTATGTAAAGCAEVTGAAATAGAAEDVADAGVAVGVDEALAAGEGVEADDVEDAGVETGDADATADCGETVVVPCWPEFTLMISGACCCAGWLRYCQSTTATNSSAMSVAVTEAIAIQRGSTPRCCCT